MKRVVLAIGLSLAALLAALPVLPARAADNQAFLGIFAETSTMKMAGMPEIQLPPGVKLPNMPGIPSFGKPERKLTVRLWSPGIAPAGATASLAVPAGLKQGDKLDLELYRPEPGQTEDTSVAPGPGAMPDMDKFTIKLYWGSSDTVKPGQPKVITFGDLPPEQKQAMKAEAAKMRQSTSYFYKPDWTTGYWPTKAQPGTIDPEARLAGKYDLTSSYTGNVSIEAPDNVDFLAPIEMTSPNLAQRPSLAGPLVFQWKPIPNLLGSIAMVMGMEGQTTLILWTSSEIPAQWSADYDYMQMADVKAKVQTTEFMAGDRQDVHVPAGIFKNADMAMFRMTGYGPGAALAQGQPLPRIQTKNSLSIMLGGKRMAGMGGMGGR